MKKIIYLSLFITMALMSMSYESDGLDFEDDIDSEELIEDPITEVPINSRLQATTPLKTTPPENEFEDDF